MKLLIAYDGSPCSEAALQDLSTAGLGDDVEATVLCVADVWLDTPPSPAVRGFDGEVLENIAAAAERARTHALQAVSQGRAVASRAAQALQRQFPRWQVAEDACAGSPAWEIVRRAEASPFDLIVLGSHGRGRLGRLVLGSVSQRVAEEAACSVRVARPRGEALSGPPNLLVGVDGSEDAQAAVAAILARHWPQGTSVEVVGALDPVIVSAFGSFVPPLVQWADGMNTDETGALRTVVEGACERLREGGLLPLGHVLAGTPVKVLLGVSRARGVDAVFIGARGLRRIERFFLGSVSASLAARARCTVEIVRCRTKVAPLARGAYASAGAASDVPPV